jgi:hypothetical protein
MGLAEFFNAPDRGDVWSEVAKEIGAEYQERSMDYILHGGDGRVVLLRVERWTIWLEEYAFTDRYGNKSSEFVRMRLPYDNKDGFRFSISRKLRPAGLGGVLHTIATFLGAQDVEIGDPVFDDEFVIKGNDEAKVRGLLASARLRELLQSQPYVSLQIRQSERTPRAGLLFDDRKASNELYLIPRWDQTTSVALLKSLFDLFTEMLKQLRAIGAA